jgi:hypothetical protein
MLAIERGGLLLIPRVTDMRNGLFRPEVAWSKGRASDIVFGDLFECRARAETVAIQSLMVSIACGAAEVDRLWNECARGLAACHSLSDTLLNAM